MSLHIGMAGPIATDDLVPYLYPGQGDLPTGYPGAPLIGVLIGELLRQGHRVSAFTTDRQLAGDTPVVCRGDNLMLCICPARRRAWRPNGWFRPGYILDSFALERKRLVQAMRSAAPDLIHAHWSYEFGLAAQASGLPHLVTLHDDPRTIWLHTRSMYRALRWRMALRFFSNTDTPLTAVSSYMAEAARRYTKNQIAVVPNPVADYVFASGQARARPASYRLGMVCNGWDKLKNPKPALLAFAFFRARFPAAVFHVFGREFGDGETAQRWAQSRGVADGIIFHGAVPHSQLISQLKSLDVLLHPSLEESFGVTVAEGMALGLPVVAGENSGAVPWVVGADTPMAGAAILVDVLKADAMAAALVRVFDETYEARSLAGIRRANEVFTSKAVAGAYLDRYYQIVGESAATRSAMARLRLSGTQV